MTDWQQEFKELYKDYTEVCSENWTLKCKIADAEDEKKALEGRLRASHSSFNRLKEELDEANRKRRKLLYIALHMWRKYRRMCEIVND